MERRNTIQKSLVLNTVLELQHHVTADEVYEIIREQHPHIGKGTVYRNLGILAEEGKIRRVEIPDGPDRYDHILKRHYHIRCVRCGAIYDVDMDEIADLKDRIRDTHGMTILDHDIIFKGICRECREKEETDVESVSK